jgi:hypothetical protein
MLCIHYESYSPLYSLARAVLHSARIMPPLLVMGSWLFLIEDDVVDDDADDMGS